MSIVKRHGATFVKLSFHRAHDIGRRRLTARLAVVAATLLPFLSVSEPLIRPTMLGYSADSTDAQEKWESAFRDGISQANIRENMRRLSARPHHVGSAYDKLNAEWILSKFKEWGFDAKIETFNVLFPTPKSRVLEMVEPASFTAELQEPVLPEDALTDPLHERLPGYNVYSADGDVTGRLVYVNYGNREDYAMLDRMGVSVKDAIVIARYGHGWRGNKPKLAAEHGALGCIIYSDPADDGFAKGDVLPGGGWRSSGGIQRGSVMDAEYPGDPLTPGIGATAKAKRLPLQEVRTLTKIPVLPISYADALPLLSALQGRVVPADWRGALGITYHVGPGPAVVHLKMSSSWDTKTIYDVIAKLKGAKWPDEWVIRGNHHDAWVNGADDPISGQSAMLEEARMLGLLSAHGWRPARTIIYCAWDGEEPGLLGSVEWVETHLHDLQRNAVVYINSDENERGYLAAGGTQDLQNFVGGVARTVHDPETSMSVYQRAHLAAIATAKTAAERADLRQHEDLVMGALGSGSDFVAFQDFAGISSLDFSYGDEDDGDQYHSGYDTFYWFTHFIDTDFAYGRALSQTAGTAVMRLADAQIIPVDYVPQAAAIQKYEAEIEALLKNTQEELTERAKQLGEGAFAATNDPRRPMAPPPVEAVPQSMNFSSMREAIGSLQAGAAHFSKALAAFRERGSPMLSARSVNLVNTDIIRVSRLFLDENGVPGRPWFKNLIYSSAVNAGYSSEPIAAIRDSMDDKKWHEAEAQIPRVAHVIGSVAAGIEKAACDLERAVAGVD